MAERGLSKHSDGKKSYKRESDKTPPLFTIKDHDQSMRTEGMKHYESAIDESLLKEITESGLSKHSDGEKSYNRESDNTPALFSIKDHYQPVQMVRTKHSESAIDESLLLFEKGSGQEPSMSWAGNQVSVTKYKEAERRSSPIHPIWGAEKPVVDIQSFIYDDESIKDEKEMTESGLSKHGDGEKSYKRESDNTPALFSIKDHDQPVRMVRTKHYESAIDESLLKEMDSDLSSDLKYRNDSVISKEDWSCIKIAHLYLSEQSDLEKSGVQESGEIFPSGVTQNVYHSEELKQYLEKYYHTSPHFNKYLYHELENIGNCSFALVPNLIISGRQTSKDATCSLGDALSDCPETILLLAKETAIPGNYFVHIWLQNVFKSSVPFSVPSPYDQTDNIVKFMSLFDGVFLLEVAEGDNVSDLKEIMSQRFKMEGRYYFLNILIIFECNHEDPAQLKSLFTTVNASKLNQCKFIIITSVNKTVVEALELNADRTLVSEGIESLQVSFNGGMLTLVDGKVISRNINHIASKRKSSLWEKTPIEKVRLENLEDIYFLPDCIHLPDEIRSISMHACNKTIHLVHTADILDVSWHRSFLVGTFDPSTILSSTLTTVSLCFSAKSHIFCRRIYERFANGLSQSARLTSLLLNDMKVGKKVLTVKLEKNEIEQMKVSVKTNEDYRRYGARILGPKLQKETFDKKDIDADLKHLEFDEQLEHSDSSDRPIPWEHLDSFAAYVMLDLICYDLVKTNDAITECYPAMRNKCEIVLVCYFNTHIDMTSFKGFPLVKKDNSVVSKESLRAENSLNREESTFITTADKEFVAINETVSYHADILMESHRNLEAVKVSYVKSTRGQYEHPHPCIVLYCKAKGYIPYGENSFPKRLNHPFHDKTYDTDVREGFFTSCPYLTGRSTDWNRELALGCSIGEIKTYVAATLGPFVNIQETGETCFLTVRHLFTPLPPTRNDSQLAGVKVAQPADVHLPTTVTAIPDRVCGEVLSSDIGGQIDAALVKICPERLPTRGHFVNITREDLNFAGLSLTELPTYDDGAYMDAKTLTVKDFATRRIIKIGNTTSLTKGTLSTTDGVVRETMEYTTLETLYNGSRQKYVVKSQLLVDSYVKKIFCQAGDSGSAVFLVDDDNRLHCIGMVIGMLVNDCTAVITPIKNILDILGNKLKKTLELKRFEFDQMDEH